MAALLHCVHIGRRSDVAAFTAMTHLRGGRQKDSSDNRYLAVSLATRGRGMAPDLRLIALARVHGVCFPRPGPPLLPNPARQPWGNKGDHIVYPLAGPITCPGLSPFWEPPPAKLIPIAPLSRGPAYAD
ncbi:unnamed protein product [Nezara viridula]|uniref:Uncharacterized protein n=1 Tax=Nezara viridula TaxID=85310 RepID=A0A9P0E127_NEZVI|nr:unnamed protein product [Nezara viridula]